ncbi:hypothetical protein KM800_05075 [Clostridium tyrobutyricum]|uniref:hypothetical protein n=1 Tax=Clostridium tyrobutyricum TaxID=1519 RepID=UPI001C394488|nr:hypothetical protein [Clostridium tyrobutyricum]MBV4418703.1 hypothetical protein [Clostridium tyrobutyricum]
MNNKLATCKIITNLKNFNILIDFFIENIPSEIEKYNYIKIISSFITNNILSFDITYSCSDKIIKNIFENVFKNVMKRIIYNSPEFTIEIQNIS